MGKPHPIELRLRVVAFVKEGNSHREAARHFRVSPRFVNNMIILEQSSGSLTPPKQGHPPGGKLTAHGKWITVTGVVVPPCPLSPDLGSSSMGERQGVSPWRLYWRFSRSGGAEGRLIANGRTRSRHGSFGEFASRRDGERSRGTSWHQGEPPVVLANTGAAGQAGLA
jgi:hypothetical protein